MLTKEEVIQLLNPVKDPFLHRTFEETEGIKEVTIKEDKKHVSVKVAIGKTNTAEQMQLQQELVGILKRNGAVTVGLRFEQLPDDLIKEFDVRVRGDSRHRNSSIRLVFTLLFSVYFFIFLKAHRFKNFSSTRIIIIP